MSDNKQGMRVLPVLPGLVTRATTNKGGDEQGGVGGKGIFVGFEREGGKRKELKEESGKENK